jgi:PAS domain-containing protein
MSLHPLEKELLSEIPDLWSWIESGSLDGVWFWDIEDGDAEWMSPRFWSTLGYDHTLRSHSASEWQDLIHPEDLELALENFTKHLADRSYPYDQIVRYKRGPGRTDLGDTEWVWVRCRGKIIDRDDQPCRMVGVHQDISQLMLSLETAQNRLRSLEATLRNIEAAVGTVHE